MNLRELKRIMPDIFEQVKHNVRSVMGRHRAGLSLGLIEMGMFRGGFIGGMHFYPGTDIVMNKTPLKIILKEQPYEIVWAYTYHILLHEYVHSLGIINEQQCQAITLKISEEIFNDSDPALIFAKRGIGAYFKDLNILYAPPDLNRRGFSIEYVSGFDRESQTYFS